ncbi:MAG: glycosyltransferase, partial [Spirochaetales bacterium]|nr:glycosyltransferase [Spirochaetales bacterium]
FVITGNEEGKKEILENYPMPPNKIHICEFPVASFCRGDESKPVFDVPPQSFFYPAQFWPHKNHICILKALKILNDEYKINPMIFFTGSDKGNKEYINKKIIEYHLEEQVKFTGFISDKELKYLYTHTTAMIFASLMGHNNMPPIEATYLNCPVIITNLDGHKEQLKDSALYFNGYDPNDLACKMFNILSDESLRNEIKSRQKSLAEYFDTINYFANIKKIINQFELIRQTWE